MLIQNKKAGFTIVELLIVVVVIAILAAITIVSFTGIQNRAYQTSVQNDLNTLAKKIEQYKVLNNGATPTPTEAQLSVAFDGAKVSRNAYDPVGLLSSSNYHNLIYCRDSNGQDFGLAAWARDGSGFSYSNSSIGAFNYAPAVSVTTCPRLVSSWNNGDMLWLYFSPSGWRASL